jgi:hypothetical protein
MMLYRNKLEHLPQLFTSTLHVRLEAYGSEACKFRLGCKRMTVANILAYYEMAKITAENFIAQASFIQHICSYLLCFAIDVVQLHIALNKMLSFNNSQYLICEEE